jgi:carboxypeptidase family protein
MAATQRRRAAQQLRSLLVSAAVAVSVGSGALGFQTPNQQAAPRPTGMIIGRVQDAIRNTPLTGVTVTLSGSGVGARRVIVDAQGRFMFQELPAGAFTIVATKTGFLDGAYGMLRPDGSGRMLELGSGERVTDALVRMWRFSTITGTVRDDAGDPVIGARVQVLKRTIVGGQWRLVSTGLGGNADERGVYRVASLAPGDYALVVTSMLTSLPASLMLVANAAKSASTQEAGELIGDFQTNGTGGFLSDLMQGFPVTRAGDLLLQGSATLAADGRSVEIYPTVWYPAAATPADAAIVTVGSGDTRSGIDLQPTLTRARRISGTVTGPDGPAAHLALRLVPAALDNAAAEITSSLSLSLTTAMSSTDAAGRFTFLAPPGQYIIRAMTLPRAPVAPAPVPTVVQTGDGRATAVAGGPAPPPLVATDPTLWAAVPVSVDETDTSNVAVALRTGLRVTGRVEFAGTTPPPEGDRLRAIRLTMDQADGRMVAYPSAYQAQIDSTGRFYTIGLMAGRYLLRVESPPRGWTVKSAIVGGRDIADVPLTLENDDVDGLVLTFTDRPASLAGSVRNAQGQPDDAATVLVFPGDRNWTNLGLSPRRMQSVRASRSGTFTFPILPAGDYFVIAVSDAIVNNWQDPAFLQRLTRSATRVSLTDAQAQSVILTTATGISR